jgi:7-carboxy-7-deazaguanine synthase
MNKYPINDVYACIQGEGVNTGVPMVMLRLHGCDVGCPFCDTKFTWHFRPENERHTIEDALGENPLYCYKAPTEIAYYLRQHYPAHKWILLSGGEPAQYHLKPLAAALHDAGYKVALETSGTELGHIDAGLDWVCVSPKINMPGGKQVLPEALAAADEIKHPVGKQRDIDQLETLLNHQSLKAGVQICLQPISQNPRATQLCIQTVQEKGWRLSLQLHKYIAQR